MAYYVYLLASDKYGTLYVGVTSDIVRRVYEHKSKFVAGFSKRYSVDKLVRFEIYEDAITAITREKELKKWRKMPLSTRRSFTRRTPRGLFGSIGLMAVHS
jgi:putative endonuclease